MFYCDLGDLDDWADALASSPWPTLGQQGASSNNQKNNNPCFFETKESLSIKRQALIKKRNALSVYKAREIIDLNNEIQEITEQLNTFKETR
jgi:Tfp pilus assembly protein PilN